MQKLMALAYEHVIQIVPELTVGEDVAAFRCHSS